ncbi:MAG: hypothetical protein WC755_00285 [Candidatus Woesearchaeota archaeon]|jgi:hypothetical protein
MANEVIDKQKLKITMMTAVSQALSYKEANKTADSDTVLKHIMENFNESGTSKMAGIAAVSKAMEYKERKTFRTDKEIIQQVMKDSDAIIDDMSQ